MSTVPAEQANEALVYTPIAPDPTTPCPCNPATDLCGCIGRQPIRDCRCYRYVVENRDAWGSWPWPAEALWFERDGVLDLAEARRRSALVVDAFLELPGARFDAREDEAVIW